MDVVVFDDVVLALGDDASTGDFEAAQGDVVGSEVEATHDHTGAFADQADGFAGGHSFQIGSAVDFTGGPSVRGIDTFRLNAFPG